MLSNPRHHQSQPTTLYEVEKLIDEKYAQGRIYIEMTYWGRGRYDRATYTVYHLFQGQPKELRKGTLEELRIWAKYLKPQKPAANAEPFRIWQ